MSKNSISKEKKDNIQSNHIRMTEIFQDCRRLKISTPGRVTADLIGYGFTILNDL